MAHCAAVAMQVPRAVGTALALSAAVHAAALAWVALGHAKEKPAQAHSAARVALRWVDASPAAPAPVPAPVLAPAPATHDAGRPAVVVAPQARRTAARPDETLAAVTRAPEPLAAQVAQAPVPAASAVPAISGAVFALPRLAFAARAGPSRWMRAPSADRPTPEQLAAAHQVHAAQASACARQAALQLQCEEATDAVPARGEAPP